MRSTPVRIRLWRREEEMWVRIPPCPNGAGSIRVSTPPCYLNGRDTEGRSFPLHGKWLGSIPTWSTNGYEVVIGSRPHPIGYIARFESGHIHNMLWWRNWSAQDSYKVKVMGSSPVQSTKNASLAQLEVALVLHTRGQWFNSIRMYNLG